MKVYLGKYPPYISWDRLFKYVPISEDTKERICDWLYDSRLDSLRHFLNNRFGRKIKVRVDYWDSWSVDNTISIIALPLLRQLYNTNHGYGRVDKEDVPERLWDTYDDYGYSQKAWDYVMFEMIYAHKECAEGYPHEDTYYSYKEDKAIVKDPEALEGYHERVRNGFRLFGKYYQALWD